jgi:hypothetical protein
VSASTDTHATVAVGNDVCPTCEHAVDAHHWKLQRLQNRALRAIGNPDRCAPVRDLHAAFKIPYVYDYMTTCRTQAEVILYNVNPNVRGIGQEARHRKYKRFKTY